MYNTMRFEWDADKNQSNQKKHAGIDFETASRVFADPESDASQGPRGRR